MFNRLGLACLAACFTSPALADAAAHLEHAKSLDKRIIAVDTHDDIPDNFATPEADPGVRGNMQVDLPKMVEGGLDAGFFVVFVAQTTLTPEHYAAAQAQAMNKFTAIRRMALEQYPDRIGLATSADDVRRLHAEGKLAALIGIENAFALGKDLSLLPKYYELGARYMSLTHNGPNDFADSCCERETLNDAREPIFDGVSELGAQAIAEMNRLGIMVDVAHAAKATVLDAAALSQAPIISSHSALQHFVGIQRNLDDESLLAIKKNGGVVQIVAFDTYVKAQAPEKTAAIDALRKSYGIDSFAAFGKLTPEQTASYQAERAKIDAQWPPANVSDLVDHIDYAVKLIGINHVGISSDFGGGGGIDGWRDASQTHNVTAELLSRGYSQRNVIKLWGGNLLRVLKDVERVAKKMQSE